MKIQWPLLHYKSDCWPSLATQGTKIPVLTSREGEGPLHGKLCAAVRLCSIQLLGGLTHSGILRRNKVLL